MIRVEDYRKNQKKHRKLRNWVIVAIISILAFLSLSLIIKGINTKHFELPNDVIINGNEVILNFTELDLRNGKPESTIMKIQGIILKSEIKDPVIKIYLQGKLTSKYHLEKPEITILNAKGEKNLAMDLSIKLLKKGYNIENYNNYNKKIEESIIVSRIPNDEIIKELSSITKIRKTTNCLLFEGSENQTSGIIIILGKDFNISQVE